MHCAVSMSKGVKVPEGPYSTKTVSIIFLKNIHEKFLMFRLPGLFLDTVMLETRFLPMIRTFLYPAMVDTLGTGLSTDLIKLSLVILAQSRGRLSKKRLLIR